MAQSMTPQQQKLLKRLAQTEELEQARELCMRFLASSDRPKYKKPSTPRELFSQLMEGSQYSDQEIRDFLVQNSGFVAPAYVPIVFAAQGGDIAELEQAAQSISGSYSFLYDEMLVLLIAFERGPLPAVQLATVLKRNRLYGCAGRPCKNLSQLSMFVRQGADTLKYMRILRQDSLLCSYDQFTMIRLLDGLREDVDFNNFLIDDIRALQNYDKKNGTELCRTLLCYLENSKNTAKTAEELHVHRNSVYYRINKCTELLPEIDFENGTMAFLVMLSLYIAQYDYYLEQIAVTKYATQENC